MDWINSLWRPDCIFKNAKVLGRHLAAFLKIRKKKLAEKKAFTKLELPQELTFQTQTVPNHYLWMYRDKVLLLDKELHPSDYY